MLLLAWICANSPQAATFEFLVWAGGMRHFSHEQRLQAEVAGILRPPTGDAPAALVRTCPSRPRPPEIPAEAVLKKIDLYVALSVEPLGPPRSATGFREYPDRISSRVQPEPPLPPPRGAGIA
jgi:hypothetical protein